MGGCSAVRWAPPVVYVSPLTRPHNTLQHTATHCSTLQHTAIRCNTLQHAATSREGESEWGRVPHFLCPSTPARALSHFLRPSLPLTVSSLSTTPTATHCTPLQHLQHTATHCNTLQHTATRCNVPSLLSPIHTVSSLSDTHTLFSVFGVCIYVYMHVLLAAPCRQTGLQRNSTIVIVQSSRIAGFRGNLNTPAFLRRLNRIVNIQNINIAQPRHDFCSNSIARTLLLELLYISKRALDVDTQVI